MERLNFASAAATVLLLCGGPAQAQTDADKPAGPRMQIYGFAQLDLIQDFNVVNPDWADTLRPSRLPSYDGQYGRDGNFGASVKQSRFGVKGWVPTGWGELKTCFEFDLFGVGVDAGQTTMRVRHVWAELGPFLIGQTNSVFMDVDVFPNSVDYWGPNGMVFFRNPQIRWAPMTGAHELFIALERPGASGDGGIYADRIEIQNIKARFPLPDLSAHYKESGKWGHVQLAGILREIRYDDMLADAFDLSGSVTGWGASLSGVFNVSKDDVLRLQATYGEGCENYMNDAPIDVGIARNPGSVTTPVTGKALPMLSFVAFLDHAWSPRFSSSIGYSRLDVDNSDGQAADAFKTGQYALANVLWTPMKDVMAGVEGLWGNRRNNADGFSVDDWRVQFSFKVNFGWSLGGK